MRVVRPWLGWGALGFLLAAALVTGLPWPRNEVLRVSSVLCLSPLLAFAGRWLSRARAPLGSLAWKPRAKPGPRSTSALAGKLGWLAFGLPSLAAWVLSWLAFFPAIMGSDANDEWNEALGARRLGDWHTVGHILTLRLLSRVWQSPAILVLVQILALSLLVAWGCRLLRLLGSPLPGVVLVAFGIALAPVNWIDVVTIFKDVLYACAVLAMTLLLLYRYSSRELRPSLSFWAAFVAAGLVAMSYRHNGVTAVLGTVAGLLWLGENPGKTLAAGAVAIALAVGLHAVLMRASNALPQSASYGLVGLLAAHVEAGTTLTPSERAELEVLRPTVPPWPYNCLTSDPTVLDGHFNLDGLETENLDLFRLAGMLTLRAPRVTLRHLACSSSALRLLASSRAVGATELTFDSGGEMRTIAPWPAGPPEHSLLPGLRHFLGRVVYRSGYPAWDWLIWRPALALYLLLFAVIVACARVRDWRLAGVLGPAVFNTLGLVLIMPAQHVRYQYPVVLAFQLLALPMLWLPLRARAVPVAVPP